MSNDNSTNKGTLKAKLTITTLAIMNITTVVSLRGLSSEAEYGTTAAFYYIFAALVFLIPVALCAAELATGWPQKGGVFNWISQAFGHRLGFLAIYLQWLATTIWFPTVLIFAGVSLAFIGPDQTFDQALAANRFYSGIVVLVVYWFATFISLKGVKTASKISSTAGLIGTIIPGILLVTLAALYIANGNPVHFDFSMRNFFPDFTNFDNLVLAASIFLFFAGMEINAVHVSEVENPSRGYPLAIIYATIFTVIIFIFGTLSIATIIPKSDINLVQSLLIAYDKLFAHFGLGWLGNITAAAIALGVLGQIIAIISGPSAGILRVGQKGYLPLSLQKVNANGVQKNILMCQGAIVTALVIIMTVLPSVQAAYQMISQLAVILYLGMYIMLFLSVIYLRYKEPNTPRPYKLPGGKVGLWLIAGTGLIGSILAFVLSFIPPSQISTGSPSTYVGILVAGTLIFTVIPFIIYACRKPSWDTAMDD
ncbi:Glutamate/gamma-aminobutyrate antiporter [Vibrio stylophorae]|uniref:Glutamate/gamma-aminobutyrate antiporter n=1 Tax=Vibrio stylophorae TaxID=659351 RepID=A0ABM8ZTH2_9VIBR|nr:putative glutamine/gamma-aminobutyrate antiporter GadC [Vibrio stylophorae]CAH0533615.1 Glutamate/gamma-aminobutyrate antiporter [Vibrio stylophorae]